jgi:hypothetical protein
LYKYYTIKIKMSCHIRLNGLSIESARSFCCFIRDYLYNTFCLSVNVTLEHDEITYFHLTVINGKLPVPCKLFEPWLEMEFANLFLLDRRYYIGKGPMVEFICIENGLETYYFNDYIFADSELNVETLMSEYRDKNYYCVSHAPFIFDFLDEKHAIVKARVHTGIVFTANEFANGNWNDEFQTWCRPKTLNEVTLVVNM